MKLLGTNGLNKGINKVPPKFQRKLNIQKRIKQNDGNIKETFINNEVNENLSEKQSKF